MPKKLLLNIVIVIFLGLATGIRISFFQDEVELPAGKIAFMVTVKQEPKLGDKFQVITVGATKIYTSLFPKYHVGDQLKIDGEQIEGKIFNPGIEKVGQSSGLSQYFSSLKNKISQNIFSFLPNREATLVAGSVLGVDNIEAGFRDELIKTGTIHVVVVSGQNLAIVAGLFAGSVKYIGRRRALILSTIVVFFYAALTGFAPSVVRASLMVLAATLAVLWGREVMPIWNLFVAALLILFIWPTAIFEVSFQLTFAATLGIMTMGQKLSKVLEGVLVGPVSNFPPTSAHSRDNSKLDRQLVGSLRAVGSPSIAATLKRVVVGVFGQNAAIATSAYVFTAPIIFWHFGRLSLISPIANIFVAEAVAPVMIFGFLTAGSSLVFMPLAQLLAYLAFVPAFYFVKVVEIFAKF